MNASARITVTTGPDRGQMLEITDESVQIGASRDNALVLNDPLLAERQLCITRRGGRHAIFVTGTDEVEVDGTRIPPDRWVWLPQSASVHVTRRTTLEFISLLTLSEADFEAPPLDASTPGPAGGSLAAGDSGTGSSIKGTATATATVPQPAGKRAGASKSDKSGIRPKPAVARFITDQAGDPLVKLGADGHLPDLALQDGANIVPTKTQAEKPSSNTTLIAVFGLSVGMSLLMLFLDLDTPSGSAQQSEVARKAIAFFYGSESAPLEPYQKLLRRASWAHSQGDYESERGFLRNVLRLLRAENKNSITGLTRLPPEASQRFNELSNDELRALDGPTDQFRELKNDEQLERLLAILLRGG